MDGKINPVRPLKGTLPTICKAFGISKAAISQHLSGYTNNDKSQKIRAMAIQLGGREMKC